MNGGTLRAGAEEQVFQGVLSALSRGEENAAVEPYYHYCYCELRGPPTSIVSSIYTLSWDRRVGSQTAMSMAQWRACACMCRRCSISVAFFLRLGFYFFISTSFSVINITRRGSVGDELKAFCLYVFFSFFRSSISFDIQVLKRVLEINILYKSES